METQPIIFFSGVCQLNNNPRVRHPRLGTYQQYITGLWHSGWALIGVLLSLFATQTIAVAAISSTNEKNRTKNHTTPEQTVNAHN
jgi:hypothetical protein